MPAQDVTNEQLSKSDEMIRPNTSVQPQTFSQEPINPFATMPSNEGLQVKPLENKPLDRANESSGGVPQNPFLKENEKDPEESGEAMEQTVEGGAGPEVRAAESSATINDQEYAPAEVVEGPREREKVAAEVELPKEPVVTEVQQTRPQEAQVDEFKSEFWDILEQAGLSKRKVLIGGAILAVLLLAGIMYLFWPSGDDTEIVVEQEPSVSVNENNEKADVSVDKVSDGEFVAAGVNNESVATSYTFGIEFAPLDVQPISQWGTLDGVLTGFILGDALYLAPNDFVRYMDLLRRMQNIYETNVYGLIDQAVNRRETLAAHLQQIDYLLQEGEATYYEVENKMATLDAVYGPLTESKELDETAFFTTLQNLEGENSYQYLNSFVGRSQEASRIKAYYNAYKEIKGMLGSSVNALRPRYDDIKANEEALVKGVKVFDIPESDIDAIIRLQQ